MARCRIDSPEEGCPQGPIRKTAILFRFAEYFKDTQALLAGYTGYGADQVLRHLEPIVVVDESHNAESKLSTEMLNNLNPSFVLDLTATPRQKQQHYLLCGRPVS